MLTIPETNPSFGSAMHRYLVLGLLALTVSLGLRCAQNSERAALDEPITPPGTVEREP